MTNYLTAGETAELMRSGKEYQIKVMSGPEMLTGREMVKKISGIGLCNMDVEWLSEWGKGGEVIELRDGNKRRYPEWQLSGAIWGNITQISECLDLCGWGLYHWMVTQNGGLDGKTPRQALEDGWIKRVLKVAGADGAA